jgi:hypothetical protein
MLQHQQTAARLLRFRSSKSVRKTLFEDTKMSGVYSKTEVPKKLKDNEPSPFVRRHPLFPPALVLMSYPLALIALIALGVLFGWATGMFDSSVPDPK